ncbi:MAG: DUF2339 domain-containing protein, partial [Thermoguttaceae bacterium]
MDELYIVFAVAVAVAIVGEILALPIIAIFQGKRISRLRARIEQLERQLLAESAPGVRSASAKLSAVPGRSAVGEPAVSEPVLPAELVAEPPALPPPPSGAGRETPGEGLEAWVGQRLLGWVAVVLLLFATAFFLKQVFDNRWIGETGRVTLGVTAGLALCLAGLRYHRNGSRRFSQMLTAGGVVLLYLSTFAAF